MDRAEFKDRLRRGPLLLDGAMGTLLHERGVRIDECFDALNDSQPAVVAGIHRDYISAGADIIETNSFGANRFKLGAHGLESKVGAINSAAVMIARRVIEGSFQPVLLGGAIGPLGVRLAPLGRVSPAQASAAYEEQIRSLLQPEGDVAGVDLLIIETLSDLEEMEAAVSAGRSLSPETPIIAQLSFTRDDRTLLGDSPADVARRLTQLDVDAIGVNCSGGPAQVLRLITVMREVAPDMALSAVPNAGWPEQTDGGRVLYPATPAYFADYAASFVEAGASLIGGCCGTDPSHISAMRRALDRPVKRKPTRRSVARATREPDRTLVADAPTRLSEALSQGHFIRTVELRPPKGVSTHRLLAGARTLREAGANFLNVADSPLARMRMSAWAAAHLVQQEIGVEAILHFPTRGRNLLRVQGDLLAAHAMRVRNLFVVMGDPTHVGDYPEAMDDYDIVPSGLIRLIKARLNTGLEQSGQSIDRPTSFCVGCALSLEPTDLERELRLLRRKARSGADFALTQPVFSAEVARATIIRFREELGDTMVPIIAGIQPLYNARNADFLHNEVPGIVVLAEHRKRVRSAENPQREGVRIAQEIAEELRPDIQGVYLIPQFGRYDLVAEVLDVIRGN